jgi:integrase
MPRVKLTERTIAKLRAPAPCGKPIIYWDAELRGFGVLCSGKTTTRTFVAQRDLPSGKTRRVTVAAVNEVALTEARDAARGLLVDMRRGIDPKNRSGAGRTLRETLDAYLKSNKELSPRSRDIYEHLITHHLKPWLDRPLSGITPAEVDEMHRTMAAKVAKRGMYSGHSVANDAMRALRLLYNWAAHRDDSMPRNPVRLRKKEWHPVVPRRRPVDPEHLAEFYNAVCELPALGRDYLLLMLFTGLRRREAAGLRWSEVDFAERVIKLPAARAKAGRPLDLPMVDVVFDLLVARRQLGNAGYVFPSYGRGGHIQDPRAWLDAVRAATGIEFSCHDLRRTYLTVAESADISVLALKALVNHSLGAGVTESYIKMTAERLREPAQRVCDKMKGICGITTIEGENVEPLRSK